MLVYKTLQAIFLVLVHYIAKPTLKTISSPITSNTSTKKKENVPLDFPHLLLELTLQKT